MPFWQVSVCVHASPSLQEVPFDLSPNPHTPPPQVAKYGFNGADTAHFLDHTWEFVNIDARVSKSTTMWPQGMTPQQIADELGQALDRLNASGARPFKPARARPAVVPRSASSSR